MTNDKLKKLELNLTKSAIKAQPGAVRYKYGVLEEGTRFWYSRFITIIYI